MKASYRIKPTQSQLCSPLGATVGGVRGGPLPTATRRLMEERFGYDFSRVRVHHDFSSQQTASLLRAAAYTVGTDIFFGAGYYAPDTLAGRRLIAHELAHVVQQATDLETSNQFNAPAAWESRAELQARRALAEGQPRLTRLQSLPEPSRPVPQCYRVPGELRCDELVDWLNTSSPYSPEWAQTNCNYSFNGRLRTRHQTSPDGTVEVTVSGHNKLTVSVSCPIDRPDWTPTRRPNRAAEVAAWSAMRASLDAHEREHRRIGQEWRTTLQDRFRAVNFSVTGNSQEEAMTQAQTQTVTDQQSWMTEAQAAQDAIDPFRGAVLTCP